MVSFRRDITAGTPRPQSPPLYSTIRRAKRKANARIVEWMEDTLALPTSPRPLYSTHSSEKANARIASGWIATLSPTHPEGHELDSRTDSKAFEVPPQMLWELTTCEGNCVPTGSVV